MKQDDGRNRLWPLAAVVVGALGTIACTSDDTGLPILADDAGLLVPDATTFDAATPDASRPDASVPDSSVPDSSVPDALASDASDASVPDASDAAATTTDAGADAAEDASDAASPFDAASTFDAAACVDAGGHCEIVLAPAESYPSSIVVVGGTVYWTDGSGTGTGYVKSAPVNGGAITTLASGSDIQGLAVTSTALYWSDYTQGGIYTAPLAGVPDAGAGTSFSPAESGPEHVATDGTNLYWTSIAGAIRMKPLTGSTAATTLVTQGEPEGIAVDATTVYFSDYASGNTGAGGVYSVPIGGTMATPLVTGITAPSSIAVDTSFVYVDTKDQVLKFPKTGIDDAAAATVIASGRTFPQGIALAGGLAYWADANQVWSATAAGGGSATPIAPGGGYILPLTTDGTNLYFGEYVASGVVAQVTR